MPHITLQLPIVGGPDQTEEPKIPIDFSGLAQLLNGGTGSTGGLDQDNLAQAFWTSIQNALVPVGTSLDFRGSTAPPGFLLEDFSVYKQTDYPNLYAVIGNSYGNGTEQAGYFRVPDSRGYVSVGADSLRRPTDRAVGYAAGEENHTLLASESGTNSNGVTGNESVTHQHEVQGDTWGQNINAHTHSGNTASVIPSTGNQAPVTNQYIRSYHTVGGGPYSLPGLDSGDYWWGDNLSHRHSFTSGYADQSTNHAHHMDFWSQAEPWYQYHTHQLVARNADAAHNNMQPYLVVLKIIKF